MLRVTPWAVTPTVNSDVVDRDEIATTQLAATSLFDLAVDSHSPLAQQILGVCAGVDNSSEFEELTEPNHVSADLDGAHRRHHRRYRVATFDSTH